MCLDYFHDAPLYMAWYGMVWHGDMNYVHSKMHKNN